MASRRSGRNDNQGRKKRDTPKEDKHEEVNSSYSSLDNITDLLVWLRRLALNPVSAKMRTESNNELRDQMLCVRRLLRLENPELRSKRKVELSRSGAGFSVASSDKSRDSNFRKKRRESYDSDSCLRFVGNSTSSLSTPVNGDTNGYVSSSDRSDSEGEFIKLVFDENNIPPRPVIPVAPGFQADLPDYKGSLKKSTRYLGDSKTLTWLRTRTWPVQGRRKKPVRTEVGKGRPDSCSCVSPGSTDCIRQHINEARQQLKSDLGPAFLTWKFDKMGEVVSDSWTAKEEEKFESLMKKNPLSSGTKFWQAASKTLPSKSKISLLSYYYNVFLVRRIRSLNDSSVDEVESDDDNNAERYRDG